MPWVMKRPGMRYQAIYRDPAGRKRSAGTFNSEREARAAARRAESSVELGTWYDRTAGQVTFRYYVEQTWWPSRHLELSTKQSYRSYLDKHFLPYFGDQPMVKIPPSTVQGWVTEAVADGLSANSVTKYHVMLHSIFKRAVRDRIIAFNPCTDIELPKVVTRKMPSLTPEEFDRLLDVVPERWTPLVLTAIETGLRWGELIALRPRHVDFLRRTVSVKETIVELSRKHSPTGERMIITPYPKDYEPRTVGVSQDLLEVLAARMKSLGIDRDDLLSRPPKPLAAIPIPQHLPDAGLLRVLEEAQLGHHVRMHEYADLRVMPTSAQTGWSGREVDLRRSA